MNTLPTPETDNHARCYQTAGMPDAYRILLDFARKLERERDEARGQNIKDQHLILKLETERDLLRKVADELAAELQYGPVAGCNPKAVNFYNSLPHVKEKANTK